MIDWILSDPDRVNRFAIDASGLSVLSAAYSNPSLTILKLFNLPIVVVVGLIIALDPTVLAVPTSRLLITGNLE